MAGRIFQQIGVTDMVPYQGKMKFKDPTSEVKVTVQVNTPKSASTFARFKGYFKTRDTNVQMPDDSLGGGPFYDTGSYKNLPHTDTAYRRSYRRATGGAYYSSTPQDPQQPDEDFLPYEHVPCQSRHSLSLSRFEEQDALLAQLPTQPHVDRENQVERPALPPPIPPRGRSQARHQVDPDYGNTNQDIYTEAYKCQPSEQQLNVLRLEDLVNPPTKPPRGIKPALNQDFEIEEELYNKTDKFTAQESSLSNHQESSDSKKIMQVIDDDISDEDTFGDELMTSYIKILQAKQAPGNNTMDADGYTSMIPRTTDEYINGDFAPTSNNPPFPKNGQMWLSWTADGRDVCLPVNIAEREQAVESFV